MTRVHWPDVKKLLDDKSVPEEQKKELLKSYLNHHLNDGTDSADEAGDYKDKLGVKDSDLKPPFVYSPDGRYTDKEFDDAYDKATKSANGGHDNDVKDGKGKLDDVKNKATDGSAGTDSSNTLLDAGQPGMRFFGNFLPLYGKLPETIKKNPPQGAPVDVKGTQEAYDQHRDISFGNFTKDADEMIAAAHTEREQNTQMANALNGLYHHWSGKASQSSQTSYTQVDQGVSKVSQALEDTGNISKQAMHTTSEAVRGKAQWLLDNDVNSDAYDDKTPGQIEIIIKCADGSADDGQLKEVAKYVGVDVDDGCGDEDTYKTRVPVESIKWLNNFATAVEGKIQGFHQVCDSTKKTVDGAFKTLTDQLGKINGDAFAPAHDKGGQHDRPQDKKGADNGGSGGHQQQPPNSGGGGNGGTTSSSGAGGPSGGSPGAMPNVGSGGSGSSGGSPGGGGQQNGISPEDAAKIANIGKGAGFQTTPSGTGGAPGGGQGGAGQLPGATTDPSGAGQNGMPSGGIPNGGQGGLPGGSLPGGGQNGLPGGGFPGGHDGHLPGHPGMGGAGDQPEKVTVKHGNQTITMSHPDTSGKMSITVDDGHGKPKTYEVDFGSTDGAKHAMTSDFGPQGGNVHAEGADGKVQHVEPGRDGTATFTDGHTKFTVERGPDGTATVSVDDGKGGPTEYTLDAEHDDSASGRYDSLSGKHSADSFTSGRHGDAFDASSGGGSHSSGASGGGGGGGGSTGGGGFGGGGAGGGGGLPGGGSGSAPAAGGQVGAVGMPGGGETPAAAVASAGGGGAGGAAGGGPGGTGGGMMGGMPMGGMGGGGQGGDQQRGGSQWRTEGQLFDDDEPLVAVRNIRGVLGED